MASKRMQLTIHTPCQQSWQRMKIDEAGRFCSSCQKTVVDFTGLTDDQIADTLEKHKQFTCGRFRVDQLNRSLPINTPTSRSPVPFFSLLTAGLLGYQPAQADALPTQTDAIYMDTSQSVFSVSSPIDETLSTDSSRVITGRVVDQSEGAPLPGASVFIKGTSTGITTDKAGNFQLSIPSGKNDEMTVLQVTMIGYQTCEIQLAPNQLKPLSIKLYEDVAALGEVVVMGNYKKLSFWQRLRNRFRATH